MTELVHIPTVKIKSTHQPSQGDFVVINAADFDEAKGHVLYSIDEKPKKAKK
jgi:hypothetical protein